MASPCWGGQSRAYLPLAEAQRMPRECSGVALLQQLLAPQLPAADDVVAEHKLAVGADPGQLVLEREPRGYPHCRLCAQAVPTAQQGHPSPALLQGLLPVTCWPLDLHVARRL